MTSSYSGQVKTLAFAPVAALFDVTAASVRYFAVGVAALALLATYAFTVGCSGARRSRLWRS